MSKNNPTGRGYYADVAAEILAALPGDGLKISPAKAAEKTTQEIHRYILSNNGAMKFAFLPPAADLTHLNPSVVSGRKAGLIEAKHGIYDPSAQFRACATEALEKNLPILVYERIPPKGEENKFKSFCIVFAAQSPNGSLTYYAFAVTDHSEKPNVKNILQSSFSIITAFKYNERDSSLQLKALAGHFPKGIQTYQALALSPQEHAQAIGTEKQDARNERLLAALYTLAGTQPAQLKRLGISIDPKILLAQQQGALDVKRDVKPEVLALFDAFLKQNNAADWKQSSFGEEGIKAGVYTTSQQAALELATNNQRQR